MATPSFYSTDLSVALLQSDNPVVTLCESESSHAVRSRRLREGQAVNVLNGLGVSASGTILVINKRSVEIKLDSYHFSEKKVPTLTIATAIPKGDRQKVMVDMLTQLGVSEIIPLECEHSVTRYSDNLRQKWLRSAIESCKQSQNPWLPKITKAYNIQQLIEKNDYYIVYADASGQSMTSVRSAVAKSDVSNLMMIIGPEGGLSKSELTFLNSQYIQSISLANNILRTETAAITAMSKFVQIN